MVRWLFIVRDMYRQAARSWQAHLIAVRALKALRAVEERVEAKRIADWKVDPCGQSEVARKRRAMNIHPVVGPATEAGNRIVPIERPALH